MSNTNNQSQVNLVNEVEFSSLPPKSPLYEPESPWNVNLSPILIKEYQNVNMEILHKMPELRIINRITSDDNLEVSLPNSSQVETMVVKNKGKRKWEGNTSQNPSQQQVKKSKPARTNVTGPDNRKTYHGNQPYCNKCNRHHKGQCGTPCEKCKRYGHRAKYCRIPTPTINPSTKNHCYECGSTKHFKKNCPISKKGLPSKKVKLKQPQDSTTETDIGQFKQTVSSIRKNMMTLQTEVTVLRMRLEQSERRATEAEQRMTTMENSLGRAEALEKAITGMVPTITRINYN